MAAGLSPAATVARIVAHLEGLRSAENIAGMARYGIRTEAALGISNPDMRSIADWSVATMPARWSCGRAASARRGCSPSTPPTPPA